MIILDVIVLVYINKKYIRICYSLFKCYLYLQVKYDINKNEYSVSKDFP